MPNDGSDKALDIYKQFKSQVWPEGGSDNELKDFIGKVKL